MELHDTDIASKMPDLKEEMGPFAPRFRENLEAVRRHKRTVREYADALDEYIARFEYIGKALGDSPQ